MKGFFVTDASFLGRRHPVTRTLFMVLLCVPPMIVRDPGPMAIVVACYAAIAAASRALASVWRIRALVVVFFFTTTVMWSVFFPAPDPPLLEVLFVRVTPGSIAHGVAMALRLLAFLLAAMIYLSATRIEEMSFALERLGVPYRASFALSLAFRLTPLFLESARHIQTAQIARGVDFDAGSVLTRARRYVSILVPVLVAALRNADGLALALESKGFGAPGERTSMFEYRAGAADLAVLLLGAAMIAAAVAWRMVE
ncbi:energy-coupling factor transporter transmembrane protein EcfT [bacterium]|nr:energy-coupling factor transporter transmembrane protein EcfT [bacterium]